MFKNTVVLLVGNSRAGKNTIADIITEKYGLVQHSFAAKVKEVAAALRINVNGVEVPYWDGRDETKRFPCVEIGHKLRQILGQDIWVDQLYKNSNKFWYDFSTSGVVITDGRYENEVTCSDYYVTRQSSSMNKTKFYSVYIDNPNVSPQGADAETVPLARRLCKYEVDNSRNFLDDSGNEIANVKRNLVLQVRAILK